MANSLANGGRIAGTMGSGDAWTDTSSIQIDNNAYATCIIVGIQSKYLIVQNLTWPTVIPDEAINIGIQVDISRFDPSGHTADFGVRLLDNGTLYGRNHADDSQQWETELTNKTYGGPYDSWNGGTLLTAAMLNNPLFGFALAVSNDSNPGTALVRYMTIKSYFNIPSIENLHPDLYI